jgi:hypothetical protein
MLISITCQKPKQDFLSWFALSFTFTSLYFCKNNHQYIPPYQYVPG